MAGDAPADVERSAVERPAVARSTILRGLARTTLSVVAVLVLYFVLPYGRGFDATTVLTLIAGIIAIGCLVAWQVRAILHSRHPAVRAIESVALSLPLFILLFAATYYVLEATDPNSFTQPLTRVDSLYFVVTVFTTVGFGDITPVSQVARVLTTVQMVLDLVLIGLVLRVFVTAVDRGRRRPVEERTGR